MVRRKWALSVGIGSLLSFAGSEAHAQDEAADASRRALIGEAQEAANRRDHTRAVELANRAAQVRMTPSLRLFLAEEYAELRDWLRTYTSATQCRSEALADPSLPHRSRMVRRCAHLEAQSLPHVAFLVIQAPVGMPGLRVRVADVEVPAALWGVRYPVAAGTVAIDAGTSDQRTFRTEIQVAEGQTREVPLTLSEPPPAPQPAPSPMRHAVSPPPPQRPMPVLRVPAPQRPPPEAGPGWIGPVALGAGGAIVLSLGGVFAGLRSGARDARDVADQRFDETAATSEHDSFQTYTTLTNVALGVGAACVLGGAVWFTLSRVTSRRPRTALVSPSLAANANGATLSLGGVW